MSPEIRTIQQGLRALGHDPGAIDGVFGPRTRRAIEALLAAGGARLAPPPPAAPSGRLALYQGAARHPVGEIVVHCSATRPEWLTTAPLQFKRTEIRRWHLARGWRDIGYHWLIDRDGQIAPGRPETEIGAGVEGHNRGVIHICLIGGHGSAATDPFTGNFTAAQDINLRQLISGIEVRARIGRISGHNEWAAKACPGFNVPAWLREAA